MAKPVIKFKTYRQAAAVGGKIYGVPNLGDPVVAEVTMQEVIDYAKLHNYSADTLSALLSQVIAGVGDLVARDGRPRMLSDLLKFEPVIKGTFSNMEQTVTNQKVLVRPRMLKEIKVALDPSAYAWQNQNDKDSPHITTVAPVSDLFAEINRAALVAAISTANGTGFGFIYSGSRLCPNGWDPSCKMDIILKVDDPDHPNGIHLSRRAFSGSSGEWAGLFFHDSGTDAAANAFVSSRSVSVPQGDTFLGPAWSLDPSSGEEQFFTWDDLDAYLPTAPEVVFRFTRTTSSGDTFTVEKSYML